MKYIKFRLIDRKSAKKLAEDLEESPDLLVGLWECTYEEIDTTSKKLIRKGFKPAKIEALVYTMGRIFTEELKAYRKGKIAWVSHREYLKWEYAHQ